MKPNVTPPVSRFHRVLVDEIKKQQPSYLSNSFTVAEIYQILVPYRSHRDALGVEMNGDYEDALLRLLAGAGELLVLESAEAQARILKELSSKNPNTGLFREFAAAEVHLNPDRLHPDHLPNAVRKELPQEPVRIDVDVEVEPTAHTESEERSQPAPTYFDFETSTVESMETAASNSAGTTTAARPVTQAVSARAAKSTATRPQPATRKRATDEPGAGIWKPGELPVSSATESKVSDCLWCDEQLPDRDVLNFCPHCGTSTTVKPCASCGSEMDMGWRFCVSCGSESKGPLAKAS